MGHVPQSETRDIEILTFEEALVPTYKEEYNREKWLYIPDFYSEYRYILGTVGNNPLICIGINPSTAKPDALDNTLKSAQRIALSNGYDSFIMFNVYAQRATNPDDMEKEANMSLHLENLKAFEYLLKKYDKAPDLWAAWGAVIEKRKYLKNLVSDIIALGEKYNAVWYTAGARSKKAGHPHHPLYIKSDTPLEKFDAYAYLNNLFAD